MNQKKAMERKMYADKAPKGNQKDEKGPLSYEELNNACQMLFQQNQRVTMDDSNGNPMDCLLLNDRDVLYSFEGEEEDEPIKIPKKKIIL